MGSHHLGLLKKLMNIFSKNYFLKHYGKFDSKNPPFKVEAYLKEIISVSPDNGSTIKILDIGCGYGAFLNLLETKGGFDTYGIDAGDFAINKAKKRARRTKFWVTTIDNFKTKNKFDLITAFDVLEHIPDLDNALKKIKKLLVSEGLFVCVVPVYDGIFGKIGEFLDKDTTHVHKKNRQFWLNKLNTQFKILRVKGILRGDFPVIGYAQIKSQFLASTGQAILISAKKR